MNLKMIILIVLLMTTIFILALTFGRESEKPKVEKITEFAQIENIFNKNNDTVYIINFWATTCPPCLKELPLFEEMKEKYRDKKLKIYLINIDDEEKYEKAVIPFVNKLKLKNKVYALVDDNLTNWTAKVNEQWYGALPYTVIYKGDKRKFFFGAFKDENDLEKELLKMF